MRLDSYSKNQLQERAAEFFLRLQHTNPFPAMVDGVVPNVKDPTFQTYISCLPQHIRDAVLTLMADECYIDILDTNTASSLVTTIQHPTDPSRFADVLIEFHFSQRRPSSTHWGRKAKLDPNHLMLDEINEWVLKAKEINQDHKRCRSFIFNIVEYANTVGQLRTMFPDYVRMLSDSQQQHISKMQKRSPLPKGVDLEYLNEHRQFVAEKVALCLLLPEGGEKIWLG